MQLITSLLYSDFLVSKMCMLRNQKFSFSFIHIFNVLSLTVKVSSDMLPPSHMCVCVCVSACVCVYVCVCLRVCEIPISLHLQYM